MATPLRSCRERDQCVRHDQDDTREKPQDATPDAITSAIAVPTRSAAASISRSARCA